MGQDTRADGTAVTQEREPQEIREEIEDTRHELGDRIAVYGPSRLTMTVSD